ncbi:methylated-DNA--[protein]-cysteine S-methyltransferase [Pirellulaceae bacterium SH467]
MHSTEWMESPIGMIAITCESNEVVGIHFRDQRDCPANVRNAASRTAASRTDCDLSHSLHRRVIEQLFEYFEGSRTEFDFPIRFVGTEFQKRVWEELLTIPYGETCSYQTIAEQIGAVRAVRAVGGAIGKNPLSIVAPCHRVLGKDRTLTGYAGGLDRKRYLLQRESPQGVGVWKEVRAVSIQAEVMECR